MSVHGIEQPVSERLPRFVCVADRDVRDCEILASLLSLEGMGVISVTDQGALLELLQRHSPDVLILDAGIGEDNGEHALSKARSLCPDLPVIMMVQPAFETPHRFYELIAAGAWTVFSKPIDARRLLRAIRRCHSARLEAADKLNRDGERGNSH